jgi:hypothetical protein
MLALKFITMLPLAGWPGGMSGNRRRNKRVHARAQRVDHAGLLADLHDAQPQAHHADQAERDVEAGLGGVEQAVSTLGEDGHVALQQLDAARRRSRSG